MYTCNYKIVRIVNMYTCKYKIGRIVNMYTCNYKIVRIVNMYTCTNTGEGVHSLREKHFLQGGVILCMEIYIYFNLQDD